MQAIEQRLRQRYPRWFRGRRGRLAATLLRWWARWSGLDRIDAKLTGARIDIQPDSILDD
jgi:hypothetical protein